MGNKDREKPEETPEPVKLEVEVTFRRIIKKVGTAYLWRLAERKATYETKAHGLEDSRDEAMVKATGARDVAVQAKKTKPVVSK